MTQKDRNKIEFLIKLLDELGNGKFILADKKISSILKGIADSEPIYTLLYECMKSFNKEREMTKAFINLPASGGHFDKPQDDEKMLPLVFCVLVDIDSGNLDFRNFLKTFFKRDGEEEYANFAKELITPFKNILKEIFEIEDTQGKFFQNEQENTEGDESDEDIAEIKEDEFVEDCKDPVEASAFFEKIRTIALEMKHILKNEKKKKLSLDADFILDAIVVACANEDYVVLNALITGLHYVTPKLKCLKFLNRELIETLINFYEKD